jgi:hypothetical protein
MIKLVSEIGYKEAFDGVKDKAAGVLFYISCGLPKAKIDPSGTLHVITKDKMYMSYIDSIEVAEKKYKELMDYFTDNSWSITKINMGDVNKEFYARGGKPGVVIEL